MKKLLSIALLITGLFAASLAIAQKEEPTTKTATKKMGYTIINPGEAITIYKYVHAAHSPKETEKYAPKYFFVTSSSDVLRALTITNIKKIWPKNHPFHDAMDANFKEDKDLYEYDSFHKMYKVNWLLKENSK